MALLPKKLAHQLATTVIISFVAFSVYFNISIYNKYLEEAEYYVLQRLEGIANSLALSIDATSHKAITNIYADKGAIENNFEDLNYHEIHSLLYKTKVRNKLKSEIYTVFFEKDSTDRNYICYYGVNSTDTPTYRSIYLDYPSAILTYRNEGGTLSNYQNSKGNWISAYKPIKTPIGEVVGMVLIDYSFDDFIARARKRLGFNIIITVIGLLIIITIVLLIVKKIVAIDEKKNTDLQKAYFDIQQINTKLVDSINCAKQIQKSIIPDEKVLQQYFPDSFLFFRPKDTVSGDMPWIYFHATENTCLLAAVDCTGHGVPGAFMTSIAYFLLNKIIVDCNNLNPGEILTHLDIQLPKVLSNNNNLLSEGLDIAICAIKNNNEVTFSGSGRYIFHIDSKAKVDTIKGNNYIIGNSLSTVPYKFTNHYFELQEGESIILFTDGFTDQKNLQNKKFKSGNFKEIFENNYFNMGFNNFSGLLGTILDNWKNGMEQTDDILVMGIKFHKMENKL